jgi:hypothetical protein
MGADPLYNDKTNDTTLPLTGEVRIEGQDFKYKAYLLPIIGDDDDKIMDVENELVKQLGNRMQNGKHCLDIDETIVSDNIDNDEYSVIVFVENKHHNDVASGTIQYYDWCENGKKQLWINDLCRIATNKQKVSPLKALLKVCEKLAKKYIKKSDYIYLMVDNEDQTGAPVLIDIYKKYGFDIVTKNECAMDDPDDEYTLMRKQIKKRLTSKTKKQKSKGGRNTRR